MASDTQVTHEKRARRQEQAYAWAAETYGERTTQTRYQAFRFLEEALELAQTQGLDLADMVRTAEYVAARKVGETKVEIGDVALCLDILAENLGLSVDSCHTDCLQRIKSLDPVKCQAKDDAKVAFGLI